MAIISRITIFTAGQVLTASQLNNEFNNMLNEFNGNIDSSNIGTLSTLSFTNNSSSATLSINASGGTGAVLEVLS